MAMPSPVAAAPREEKQVPPNLDEMIRQVMTGNSSMEELHQVMQNRPVKLITPVTPVQSAPIAIVPMQVAPTVAEVVHMQSAPAMPVAVQPSGMDRLEQLIGSLKEVDRSKLRAGLWEIESLARTLRLELRAKPALPPVRLPYLLAIEPVSVPERLAQALEVDAATARLLSTATWPRVALRSGDQVVLEQRAHTARSMGIRACVLEKEQLLRVPVDCLIGGDQQQWALSGEFLWEEMPDPGSTVAEEKIPLQKPLLLVPGEVECSRTRDSSGGRGLHVAAGSTHTQRYLVLDLHLKDRLLRVVEGICDFRGLPGHSSSNRQSFLAFQAALQQKWPDLPVVAERTCTGTGQAREGGAALASGWPVWEEHSRICREILAPTA